VQHQRQLGLGVAGRPAAEQVRELQAQLEKLSELNATLRAEAAPSTFRRRYPSPAACAVCWYSWSVASRI
jgi:hypothetical protein